MKAQVDTKLCQGTAMCIAVAPDIFSLQANGIAEVLLDEVPVEFVADVRDAVLTCPASALSIVEDDQT
jgi:ferredoxin